MSEYIKKMDAIKSLGEEPLVFTDSTDEIQANFDWNLHVEAILEVQEEDVEPVIYGEWISINEDELYPRCKCSNCGNVDTPLAGYKFCPYCGAKMNGGNNNGKTEKAGADCKNA